MSKTKIKKNPHGTAVVGPRLRKWRKKNDLTLKEVSHALCVTEASISDWERGTRFPTRTNMDALSKYLDVPVCALFCEEDCEYKELA